MNIVLVMLDCVKNIAAAWEQFSLPIDQRSNLDHGSPVSLDSEMKNNTKEIKLSLTKFTKF